MELGIIIILVVVGLVIYGIYQGVTTSKALDEAIERRKKYVETVAPNAQIIINDGTHLFFKDDVNKVFGLDESGKTYSLSKVHSINVFKDCVSFMLIDGTMLHIGKDVTSSQQTYPLGSLGVAKVEAEMMPVLRKNLKQELDIHAINPTYQYEHDGTIWGCDMDSKTFYMTWGYIQIHPFSDLNRITVEDMRNNSLFDGNYLITLYIKSEMFPDDDEYTLTFDSMDTKFNNLLTMFKEIRKRRRF